MRMGVWPQSNFILGGGFDFEVMRVMEAVPAFSPAIALESQVQIQHAGGSGLGPEQA